MTFQELCDVMNRDQPEPGPLNKHSAAFTRAIRRVLADGYYDPEASDAQQLLDTVHALRACQRALEPAVTNCLYALGAELTELKIQEFFRS